MGNDAVSVETRSFGSDAAVADVFRASTSGAVIDLDHSWWGFGGVHGGLMLGLVTAAMLRQTKEQGRTLKQVSGKFRRAVRDPFRLEVSNSSEGKTAAWLQANAVNDAGVSIAVSGVAATSSPRELTQIAPSMPEVPAPERCPVFNVPREFVPFASRTEIRPVGDARPFSGGPEAELIAWLRLVDDDVPPDEARLVVLMDALAPSYGAILKSPKPIPTLAFSVTPGSGLGKTSSPWLLLSARTQACAADGWLLERMDAWAPDGSHLGSGEQLRLVMATT